MVLKTKKNVCIIYRFAFGFELIWKHLVDYALFGHKFDTIEVYDDSECATRCMANETCQSYNIQTNANSAKQLCELNNSSRTTEPQDFRRKPGFTYYGSVEVRVL